MIKTPESYLRTPLISWTGMPHRQGRPTVQNSTPGTLTGSLFDGKSLEKVGFAQANTSEDKRKTSLALHASNYQARVSTEKHCVSVKRRGCYIFDCIRCTGEKVGTVMHLKVLLGTFLISSCL